MTYYVDNGNGWRRFFPDIQSARKAAGDILKSNPRAFSMSEGVPIYTSETGRTANRWVRYYKPSKKEQGPEYVEYDPRIGVKTTPMYWNGKIKR